MKQTETVESLSACVARLTVAAGAGLLSGYLILLLIVILLFGLAGISLSSVVLKLSIFLGGWAFSAFLLARKSKSVTELIIKGLLLGAAEWLAVSFATLLVFKYLAPIPVTMLTVCLAGYGITRYFVRRSERRESLLLDAEPDLCGDNQVTVEVFEFEGDDLTGSLTYPNEGTLPHSEINQLSA